MGMDPQSMMRIASMINVFKANHPKFVAFLGNVFGGGICEDTVIEISMQRPGEEKVTTNFKVKQSDIELFETLKNMKN